MYQQMIRETLAELGRQGSDPRYVEAWMRLESGTLDGLADWDVAVRRAAACVEAAGTERNERLAASYAL